MVVYRSLAQPLARFYRREKLQSIRARQYATRSFDPLRILFCGSDHFSIASLNALHAVSQQEPTLIESIEVISRPGKWTGPYKKIYKEVPIAERARKLGLPLHQIDTFRGWNPPSSSINLVVAVSFGLLIPRRLIDGAKYGGLNVHPSLLPDLWGPAPLQHALLDGDKQLGLTIQTLHPTTMDKGAILAQSKVEPPYDGLEQSFQNTTGYLAPLGADLLVHTLRKGAFMMPIHDLTAHALDEMKGCIPRHARKLTLADKHIDWQTWPADKIMRYQQLLQKLWNEIDSPKGRIKLLWSGEFELQEPDKQQAAMKSGIPCLSADKNTVLINTSDGKTLSIGCCIVAGDKRSSVQHAAQKYGLFGAAHHGSTILYSALR